MIERSILTPEHVEIRLAPAGAGSRFVALVVDALVVASLSAAMGSLLLALLPRAVGYPLWASASFALGWTYHVWFETRGEGRPPGKRLMGLRVVDGRGLPISAEQSFVRNIVRVLDAAPIFYGLGALVCHLDRHGRRLGDIAADTLVVRESRGLEQAGQALQVHPHRSLRSPRVLRLARRRIGVEEREFLHALILRAPDLEPRARFDLMEDVGAFYRIKLEIDDPSLSGESLVRGLASVLFWDRRGTERSGAAGA